MLVSLEDQIDRILICTLTNLGQSCQAKPCLVSFFKKLN